MNHCTVTQGNTGKGFSVATCVGKASSRGAGRAGASCRLPRSPGWSAPWTLTHSSPWPIRRSCPHLSDCREEWGWWVFPHLILHPPSSPGCIFSSSTAALFVHRVPAPGCRVVLALVRRFLENFAVGNILWIGSCAYTHSSSTCIPQAVSFAWTRILFCQAFSVGAGTCHRFYCAENIVPSMLRFRLLPSWNPGWCWS